MKAPCVLVLAALLVPVAGLAQTEPPLGRLFFTPEQRAAIDRQRQTGNFGTTDANNGITVNGEIRRSDGRTTRWINGRQAQGEKPPHSPLPIGDTFHPDTGERESLLRNGKIAISPARREK